MPLPVVCNAVLIQQLEGKLALWTLRYKNHYFISTKLVVQRCAGCLCVHTFLYRISYQRAEARSTLKRASNGKHNLLSPLFIN